MMPITTNARAWRGALWRRLAERDVLIAAAGCLLVSLPLCWFAVYGLGWRMVNTATGVPLDAGPSTFFALLVSNALLAVPAGVALICWHCSRTSPVRGASAQPSS
jgi:hypothetical protein